MNEGYERNAYIHDGISISANDSKDNSGGGRGGGGGWEGNVGWYFKGGAGVAGDGDGGVYTTIYVQISHDSSQSKSKREFCNLPR